ncbi:hypothetical protein JCM15765_33680 [Paradesulfitobacterium aromaticivorans]
MDRIFWIECPDCHGKFYCDYELRHAGIELECPFCHKQFRVDDGPWIDERG